MKACVALLLLVASCATVPPAVQAPALAAPAQYPLDFSTRQSLSGDYDGRALAVDCVVEKVGDRLTVIGLGPQGVRVFSVVQTGTAIDAQMYLGDQRWPFPPAFLLQDVHRLLLTGDPHMVQPDGLHRFRSHSMWVEELWSDGRVMRREFEDGVVVEFEGGARAGAPPRHSRLTHGGRGYILDVVALTFQTLENSGP